MDELEGEKGRRRFAVWDYKTGSAYKYRSRRRGGGEDPFDQGRLIQNYLYPLLAESRLREKVAPDAEVVRFGYFFPGIREHGERISWERKALDSGGGVLENLLAMVAGGCFPFTDDVDDVNFSAYADAFGDAAAAAQAARRKLGNPKNEMLLPMRRLRDYE